MAGARAAQSAAKATAEAKAVYRRAGHGWNKHADAALDSGVRSASRNGVPSFYSRYGGLEMRLDFTPMAVQLAEVKQVPGSASGGAEGDVEMRDGQSETAGGRADGLAPVLPQVLMPYQRNIPHRPLRRRRWRRKTRNPRG